jgi:hypothetical protein
MRRTLLVAAIAASLLNPGTSATLVDSLWHLLSPAWAAADEGCGMDPSGGCRPAPVPQTDAGCGMDPDGCPKGS